MCVNAIGVSGSLSFSFILPVTLIDLLLYFYLAEESWPRNLVFTPSESGARNFGNLLDAVEAVDLTSEVGLTNEADLSADGHTTGEFIQ